MPTMEKSPRAFAGDGAAAAARSAAKAVWWTANGLAARAITRPTRGENAREFRSSAPPPGQNSLRKAWMEALAKDAADVRAGIYPLTETLTPPRQALDRALDFLKDARNVDQRRRKGDGVEVKSDPKTSNFPNYYRQNFHFQTDGWFSEDSARRYEAQVEALFSGAAGAMRRRSLSLLAKALMGADQRNLTILDAACGAGAFLSDLKATFPRARVMGADLSEAYLSVARRRSGATCVQTNLERTPFADQSFDAISCIYLFHELPPRVRPVVAQELARLLKPGGVLAFADSIQTSDAPELARLLEAFPVFFHEPYYSTYQELDLTELFGGVGLVEVGADQAFLTKARLYRKPSSTGVAQED